MPDDSPSEPLGEAGAQGATASPEAEGALLGAIFMDPQEALPRVLETGLKQADFSGENNGEVFQAILGLYEKGDPVDLVTASDALEKRGSLEKIGGPEYLAWLSGSVGLAANADRYAKIIIDRAVLRQLLRVASAIAEDCQGSPKDVDDVLDRAEAQVYGVRDKRASGGLRRMPDLLPAAFKRLDDIRNRGKGLTGVPTGFRELDELTGGFQRSDLIILAARPGMGKTALALNFILGAALPGKRESNRDMPAGAVALFSLEMATEQILQRFMCQISQLNLANLRTGKLEPEDTQKLTNAIEDLGRAEVYIDDTPALPVLEMRAKVRRFKSQLEARGQELSLVVVDYLQLMRASKRTDSREQEISEISRSLKGLAKEMNVPVLALSQLNRRLEDRTGKDKRPMLSDLRESGAIEQDADLIAFINRPEVYNKEDESLKGLAEIIIGKHRNGPTGLVQLKFQAHCSSFVPLERNYA